MSISQFIAFLSICVETLNEMRECDPFPAHSRYPLAGTNLSRYKDQFKGLRSLYQCNQARDLK